MIALKCKMCGGDLHPAESSTVCECEFCGTLQTIPTIDNDKKALLYSRAQRLLFNCDFDKAAGVFESIVAEFPTESEAYWGLVLCKYGIEYVTDPSSGKKIPTCHRSSFDSVLEDENFEQALENTDAVASRIYREEARAIENLREKIIEASSGIDSYDIFICYKETDENGNRTEDSVLAQDIYDALKEKGYKTFFSRITLEDIIGQEYEPYIFAALNSARIMLVIGTVYEHMNAVWVKNEWSRFLKLISKGEKKTLIPCYKDMDPHDLPKELLRLQAQDMGKIGAMQDLLRGIEKLISVPIESTDKEEEEKKKRIENIRKLAKRAQATDDVINATKYYNQLADEDPNDWEAAFYPGYLNAMNQITGQIAEVISGSIKLAFHIISQYPDDERTKACSEISGKIDTLIGSRFPIMLEQLKTHKDPSRYVDDVEDLMYVLLRFTTGLFTCKEYDLALKWLVATKEPSSILSGIPVQYETNGIREVRKLVDSAIDGIKKKQEEEKEAKRQEEDRARKKRIEEYWAAHSDEKAHLEGERKSIQAQIKEIEIERQDKLSPLNEELTIASENKEEKEIVERITRLKSELSSLGIFKRKEKRAIQEQIDAEEKKYAEIHNQICARKQAAEDKIAHVNYVIEQKITPLKARIVEIDNEFGKDR